MRLKLYLPQLEYIPHYLANNNHILILHSMDLHTLQNSLFEQRKYTFRFTMDYLKWFNCLILLSVIVSTINPLDNIPDSVYPDDILNEEPENMENFYRQDRSTLFPRVGRSHTGRLNRLRRILTKNSNFAVDSRERAVRSMHYGE
ncbi:unnamed protein product [Schistosoma turkestanicum]|nr:unnamed protein product [Schistosoma turkestanicum]